MTDVPGPLRADLLTAVLAAAPSIERVRLSRIELAPGQAPGAHHHPCDVVGVVLSGRIRFEIDGRHEVVLHAGDPFFEPRGTHVTRFDNADLDAPATFLACYLLAPGGTEIISMTAPGPAA